MRDINGTVEMKNWIQISDKYNKLLKKKKSGKN